MTISCPSCSQPVPHSEVTCPHCGQHSGYPNVRAADNPDEVTALDSRFNSAIQQTESSGCRSVLDELLKQIESAQAVLSRPLGEVTRLSRADSEIYSTFYQRIEAEVQIPADPCWDDLRAVTDTLLFGERNKRQIRFAALSLDGVGLPHYGECHIALRSSMICHRASLLEENSVIFTQHHNVNARDRYRLPAGYRASWSRRCILVAAKLAAALQPTMLHGAFAKLLLCPGASSAKDQFVEVHIWGPLTVRSMIKVKITNWGIRPRRVEIRALEEKLARYDVVFEKPD